MATTKEKGEVYEIYIRDYIRNTIGNKAYLWKDTPESILLEHNIIGSHNDARLIRKDNIENPLQDTGIDIIEITDTNECNLIQCKNGYKKGLTMSDLAGFYGWMASLDSLNGYVYYTDKLSRNITSLPANSRIQYIKKEYMDEPTHVYKTSPSFTPDDTKLEYQMKAKMLADTYFQTNKRGIISMPCGTGKTYTSYLISQKYNQIIILSPLKLFAKQNLDRFIEYGWSNASILVDSDGCRDIAKLEKIIDKNPNILISSTYDSIDVVYELLAKLSHPLIIVDEFHNITKTNIINEDDYFYKILHNMELKILFMSATPRVYELENDEDDINTDTIFGNKIFEMNFTEAISKKYITDYRIWLPSISEDNSGLTQELSIYNIEATIKNKLIYLFSCILNTGVRKTIVYCSDTKEISDMRNAVDELNKFYYLDINHQQITSTDNQYERSIILKSFADSYKIELLFSVRILDECVDIPCCDSIYITYPTSSKIRTIQRMCRSMRIDKNNKFKIANVFIWCDEYDFITDTLSSIKEYDCDFNDKIKINNNGFYKTKSDEEDFSIKKDIKLLTNIIIGIKPFRQYSWDEKLQKVIDYIEDNGKLPSVGNDDIQVRKMRYWINNQNKCYEKKISIMTNQDTKIKWKLFLDKYHDYFKDNREIWHDMIHKLINYIKINNKLPPVRVKEHNLKLLSSWTKNQIYNYAHYKDIMKQSDIRAKWEEIVEKYKDVFKSQQGIDIWFENYKSVIDYINKYNCLPNSNDNDANIKYLGKWLGTQRDNYKKNCSIMKIQNVRETWEKFITDYKKYSKNPRDVWFDSFQKVKDFVKLNKKLPDGESKDDDIRYLGRWIGSQNTNLAKLEHSMKDPEFKSLWESFIAEHRTLFKKRIKLGNI